MRLLLLFLITVMTAGPALADTLEIVIGALGKSTPAGSQIQVPLYIHNNGDRPVPVVLPEMTTFRLTKGDKTEEVTAQRVGTGKTGRHMVQAQGFLKAAYGLTLPDDLQGQIYLTAADFEGAGLYLSVVPGATKKSDYGWLPQTTDQPLDALIQLYQPYVKNISFYEPIYFLVGTELEFSKFQLSLKYRFFSPEKKYVQKHPWLQGFHFGYTQTSFWDLDSDSAPFEDTSYKPELFYTSLRLKTDMPLLDGLFFKGGIRHESNGRGGEFSRSTNTVYIEPILLFYNEKRRTGLKITPRIWAYVGNDNETNPDLDRYRGHFDLGITFGKADSLVVDTHLGWAAEGGSVQIDLTWPLHTYFFSHLDMYLQAEYVSRLAESLINYTERTEAFRLGIAIVR